MERCSSYGANSHRYRIIPYHFKLFSIIIILLLALYSGAVSVGESTSSIVFVKQIQAVSFSSKNTPQIIIDDKAEALVSSVEIISKKSEPKITVAKPTASPEAVNKADESSKNDSNEAKVETNQSENVYLTALNAYRQKNGKAPLSWDGKLADYAKSRAELFSKQGGLDSHAGFNDFIKNQNGFSMLGFNSLGENSGLGHNLGPAELIENAYGKSPSHNDNQLSDNWSHVGIGVSGTATNFIFGGNKN